MADEPEKGEPQEETTAAGHEETPESPPDVQQEEEPAASAEQPAAAPPEEPAAAPVEPAAVPEEPAASAEQPAAAPPEQPAAIPEEPAAVPAEPAAAPEEPAAIPEEPAAAQEEVPVFAFPVETPEEEKPSEAQPPEEPKPKPSGKRASIYDKAKAEGPSLESFLPPEAKGQYGVPVDKRPSTRPSAAPRVSSMQRRSRFGGLSSKARLVLGSIVDIKTTTGEYFDRRSAKFQNTYKLESNKPFNAEKVDKILKEVMQEILENLQYDPDKCASSAKVASAQIRTKVKHLEYERYKLVCIVTIGEKNSQDVYATCRFLWDPERDRYAFYSLENTHVYAIAYCFGLYYE